jgi:hypothetical protein
VIALGVIVAQVGLAHAQDAGPDLGRGVDGVQQGRPGLAPAPVDHVIDRCKGEAAVA